MSKKRACERTSYEVRRKWDKAHTKHIGFALPIGLVDDFKKRCVDTKTPQSQVIRKAMEQFLEDTK